MRRPRLTATTVILIVLLGGTRARAARDEEPPARSSGSGAPQPGEFGALGQIAVSADVQFDIVHRSQGGAGQTTVVLRPALDYFLLPSFSVGGFIGFAQASASFGPLAGNTDLTEVSLGARAGYDLRLTEVLSAWGQARLSYAHDTFTAPVGGSTGGSIVSLALFAPLLFHPAPHFFLGAGPTLSQQLANSIPNQSTATDFGLLSTIGGYF